MSRYQIANAPGIRSGVILIPVTKFTVILWMWFAEHTRAANQQEQRTTIRSGRVRSAT